MSRIESLAICCVFIGLLLAPGVARLAGMTAREFENRALAERPAFATALLLDDAYYRGLSDWMEDHLPLRRFAVAANARIALSLFGDSPEPQVWLGREGWLFLDDGLRMACTGRAPAPAILGSIARLGAALEESGRTFRWIIVPNKIAIYPEYATHRILRAAECGEARRREMFSLMQQRGAPRGFVNLYPAFANAREHYDHLLFYPDDSHITQFGAGLLLQQLVASLDPELWDPREMRPSRPMPRTGDLASMLVVREPLEVETWAIVRPEVTIADYEFEELEPGVTRRHFTSTGPDSLLVSGRTFVLHDSQFNTAMAMARPYFADATFLNWKGFDADRVAREMAAADVVVVEVVERDFYWRVERELGSVEMIEALHRALKAADGS